MSIFMWEAAYKFLVKEKEVLACFLTGSEINITDPDSNQGFEFGFESGSESGSESETRYFPDPDPKLDPK